ncbi:MAG: XRE family transcriptional regulator [Alphaproteobacteria bacterium]|uniref:helix-turn-helix domain-containing protein n=1 Tax=Brevundimonas sp. BAL3 TaxID=391600 RepID=UPI00017EBEDD|nr:helix-turn-helix transcriptional regulator [Brevundimonas sp. BAL3]EDX79995.1 Helix-turn-helix domain protein [Brevundimonas sp. BAL3]PZO09059.1 MAG: XRE family transcriptional regulator [Alphaproteobacteria bacterium]
MEMLISQDWLRRRIDTDPDLDVEAGPSIGVLESIGMFLPVELIAQDDDKVVRLTEAFGVLVRQLRRRQQWTVDQLAQKARVDPGELRSIERDPHYRPRPRVVHQLAAVFKMPERPLMKLSGATITRDQGFEAEAMRFAAKSDDLSKLTRDEQRVLNDYVKYLVDQAT